MPLVREPYTGAWQENAELTASSVLAYAPVYTCITRIAMDVGKLPTTLVEEDAAGIWHRVSVPAFSPVLRKPNRYQTWQKFAEQWMTSKLSQGNAYALKEFDQRGVVIALYLLDPTQVRPLIAPDGSVYYELGRADLAGVPDGPIVMPASAIIHDPMVCLFHPLVGVTPIYACGTIALQGMKIQDNSTTFFANGSNPGGIVLVPGAIEEEAARAIQADWQSGYSAKNRGLTAILPEGMTYQPLGMNAVDAELIKQLQWTVEQICSCFHIPAALIDSSHAPPYANSEPLILQYLTQCLQALIVAMENALDDGLGLGKTFGNAYGTSIDVDDLIWLDIKAKTDAAQQGVAGGVLTPNEARYKYFGLEAVEGGDTTYMQQQMVSTKALARRDRTDWLATPSPPDADQDDQETEDAADEDDFAKGVASVELTYA